MKNKKLNINKLFYNNHFVMAFSVVAAVILWLVVAVQFSPEEERVVENVKVHIELADFLEKAGYKAFGASDYYVDVTVRGKRNIISPASLKSEDIAVKANTAHVNSAGSYTLQLIPSRVDEGDDFEIVSLSSNTIEVFFDTEKKQEFPLVIDVTAPENGIVPDGYYIEGGYKVTPDKIKITGPASEVNKIAKVCARATISEQITTAQTLSGTVIAVGYDDSEPKYLTYGDGKADVSISVPVYKVGAFGTTVSFENAPAYFIQHPLEVSVTPSTAEFGVMEDQIKVIEGGISIASIDFSKLHSGINEIVIDDPEPEIGVLRGKPDGGFIVKVDAGDLTEKKIYFSASGIEFKNIPENFTVEPYKNETIAITVVGPADSISGLSAESLDVSADTVGATTGSGKAELALNIKIKNDDRCWVNGDYTVQAIVTQYN